MAAATINSSLARSQHLAPFFREIEAFLEYSMKDIFEQLANGVHTPCVSFSQFIRVQEAGIKLWKAKVQAATKTRFELIVNAAADTLTLMPIEPISSDSDGGYATGETFGGVINATQAPINVNAQASSTTTTIASPQDSAVADDRTLAKDKIPRPPNAFIIYRQEWHPKVVKERPDLHNIDISVIIGHKWRAETEAVKNEYKHKAEDAKRQHAIDHPGYQYQPRKPSEKKKRMTKTKLAKLRAQANTAIAPDPMKNLNEMLAKTANDKQVTVDTFQALHRQGFPKLQPSQEANNHLTFDANGEQEMLLYNQLVDWNADNPRPTGGEFREPAVLESQQLAEGQKTIDVPQHEVPYSFTQVNNIYDTPVPRPATGTSARCFHSATVEVEGQDRNYDDVMDEFFNFDARAAPVVEGDDAESALQDFQSSYMLDFE